MAADRTSFLIDIATKLNGGDSAAASLATIGDRMLAAGATAKQLEATVAKTSAVLEESASAMKTASDAVSVGEKNYKAAELAADRAAKSVEQLTQRITDQRSAMQHAMEVGDEKKFWRLAGALQNLEQRQAEATSKSAAASAAMKAEGTALDALRSKAEATANEHKTISSALESVKSATDKAKHAEDAMSGSGNVKKLAGALGDLGGPLGTAGQKAASFVDTFLDFSETIGTAAGPIAAVVVAVVALTAAFAAGTIAIARWGVGLADANRTQALLADGVAGSVAGGRELDATISKLGNVVPQTREELLGMAGDLAKTGLKGQALSDALETAAVKAAKAKFGPEFSKQLLSLDSQTARLKANFAATFGGLKIEGLLEGLSTLVALFDSSTESGKTLKFLFESLFQPIIDGATAAIPTIERVFLYAEILALKAYIALKPYGDEIKLLAEVFGVLAAVVIGVLGVALLSVVGFALAPIVAIGLFIAALIKLAEVIYNALSPAIDFVVEIGSRIIDGLVNGITNGATAVINAITGVVGGAIKAAENLLHIGSPSKVFQQIGDFTAQGFAEGVEGGSADTQGALESMVAPPDAKKGGLNMGAQFGAVTVNISIDGQGESDDGLVAKIRAAIVDVFEGDALMLGAGEVPAQ